ncbi:MAG: proline dehydrogenase family protein [Cyanobacteria bacterium]|nr:proline dehydrogenase family protein [Cyanobacteriota bacterium]
MGLLNRIIVSFLPWVPKPIVKRFAQKYVAGDSLDQALALVREFNSQGYLCTLDVLGEFINSPEEAYQAAEEYKQILRVLSEEKLNANISIKPSQMGLLLDPELCYKILQDILRVAQSCGNFVRVEMEDSACTTQTIDLYLRLKQEFPDVGIVIQAYLRRTLEDVVRICEAGAGHFRLCKGIYVEPRSEAFQDPVLINENYGLVLEEMFQRNAYVGIATHDEKLVWEAQRLIRKYHKTPDSYEFQMLLGVDPQLRELIKAGGHRLRVYIPFGKHWYAYCLRRLRENPNMVRYTLQNLWQSVSGFFMKKPQFPKVLTLSQKYPLVTRRLN